MIKIYEDLVDTTLSDEDGVDYISFCQKEINELYPELDIQVINGQSLSKIETNNYIESDLIDDITIEMCKIFERWENNNG